MRSRATESQHTVVIALIANVGTALAKLLAAVFTGSTAMWAEAFHAFADTGNELLLLVAQRSSGRPPDERTPARPRARRLLLGAHRGHGRVRERSAVVGCTKASRAFFHPHQAVVLSGCLRGSLHLGVSRRRVMLQAQRQLNTRGPGAHPHFLGTSRLELGPRRTSRLRRRRSGAGRQLARLRGRRVASSHGLPPFRMESPPSRSAVCSASSPFSWLRATGTS